MACKESDNTGRGSCQARRCAYVGMCVHRRDREFLYVTFVDSISTADKRSVTGDVRRLVVCSSGSCFIISSYNALWRVTTPLPLRSLMLLLLSPKGAIEGRGVMALEMQRGRSGGGERVCLSRVSRFPCNARDTLSLVVAKRLGLHCLIRIIPRKRVAAHSDSTMCLRSDY